MLVLNRREGEKLIVGSDVIITIRQVRGKRVQVGIEAPSHVRVLRAELRAWTDEPDSVAAAANRGCLE